MFWSTEVEKTGRFTLVAAVFDLCFFLTVPCVGLQSVIVVFPIHSHLSRDM